MARNNFTVDTLAAELAKLKEAGKGDYLVFVSDNCGGFYAPIEIDCEDDGKTIGLI